jgi:protein-tyrosine phosphatase
MDKSNYNTIISLIRSKEDNHKVHLILNEIRPKENLDVPDPYYGANLGFENVYRMLDEACEIIINKL